MKKVRLVPLALVLAALGLATGARADSLADRAPADAVGFVSWAGTDALGKGYEGSKLKGLVEVFNLPQLISQGMDEAARKDDAQKQADRKMVMEWAGAAVKAPTALYFGPMEFGGEEPAFKVAIYSQVGKEKAAAFAEQMNAMIARNKPSKDLPLAVVAAGDYLLVTIGTVPDMEKRLSGPAPADGLGNVAGFQQTMEQVGAAKGGSAMVMYVDGEAVIKLVGDGIAAKGGMGSEMWPKIADAAGFNALKRCAVAGNFDGANWSSQTFVGLGEKRSGYMALLDNKRLSDDVLKLIPKGVTCAGVIRFDGPRLFHDIRDAVVRIEPQNGGQQFDAGLQQFFAFTGVDLLKDLLEPLDDAYVIYAAVDGKGESLKNAVVANRLKDAPKLETALTTLESVVSAMIGQRDPNSVQFKTETLPAPNDKVSAHILAFPVVSPAWTVANGVLVFSTSMAGLTGAVADAGKNGAIPENPQFAELWKKVGNKEMSGFVFLDLPKLAGEFYPLAVKGLAGEKASHPEEKVPFELPALEKITANLGPVLSVYWTDKDGYHCKGTGPLPMAEMMRPESLVQMMVMFGFYVREATEVKGLP